MKKDCIVFEPSDDPELGPHCDGDVKLESYRGVIDFMDIAEVNKMNLVNEKAIVSENAFIRDAYKYNLFVQIILTSVNGVTYE